jgi:hypothetical protein
MIKKKLFFWIIWLTLVILWNYGYPQALPLYDVLVALGLSVLFIVLKKYEK